MENINIDATQRFRATLAALRYKQNETDGERKSERERENGVDTFGCQ